MSDSALEINELVVTLPTQRGPLRAVDGVSLRVEAGSLHALVGESGCGKTTVLRAVLGLVGSDTGTVRILGTETTGRTRRARRTMRSPVQFVPQDAGDALDPRNRVIDSICEPWQIARTVPKGEWRDRATALCARVGLSIDVLDRFPDELSGGQRQRVCIARALAPDPQIVVLDEPFSALDAPVGAQLAELIAELRAIRQVAFLLVSHDLAMVEYLADSISVMYLGQIVEQGPTDEIIERPRHPYTRALLAARPQADPVRARQPNPDRISGELPDPHQPPSGCRFRTRCPIAQPDCAETAPIEIALGGTHRVRCRYPEGISVSVDDANPTP